MSRSMEREGFTGLPDASFTSFLAPPAGHKFEILESGIYTSSAGGVQFYELVNGPSGYIIVGQPPLSVAGEFLCRVEHQGLVVYPGESLELYTTGASGGSLAWVTYVDVDYT